ncbi:hypothetical protein P7K49_021422 [Saguinus oedipus]|uniref:Uncharacterized protein n=1 Tax=Saguinus oedipus TaxID=9490 RepID=A0ABQ9UTE0_SAGOE|nr:hypothetical protein P7K49_021422 [Saguinus oedipus]
MDLRLHETPAQTLEYASLSPHNGTFPESATSLQLFWLAPFQALPDIFTAGPRIGDGQVRGAMWGRGQAPSVVPSASPAASEGSSEQEATKEGKGQAVLRGPPASKVGLQAQQSTRVPQQTLQGALESRGGERRKKCGTETGLRNLRTNKAPHIYFLQASCPRYQRPHQAVPPPPARLRSCQQKQVRTRKKSSWQSTRGPGGGSSDGWGHSPQAALL